MKRGTLGGSLLVCGTSAANPAEPGSSECSDLLATSLNQHGGAALRWWHSSRSHSG